MRNVEFIPAYAFPVTAPWGFIGESPYGLAGATVITGLQPHPNRDRRG